MFTFKKGQIVVVKKSGLMPTGQFELVDVVSTGQGSYNFKLKDVKSGITITKGQSVVEKVLFTDSDSKLYDDVEELEAGKITGTGKWAEKRVIENVSRSYESPIISEGDVWKKSYLDEDRKDLHIIKMEVKSANSSKPKNQDNLTMNQIRPIKYHVVVAVVSNLSGFTKDCVVYPPDELVRRAITKRGQHTVDALMIVNLTCKPTDEKEFGCSFDELNIYIKKAYLTGLSNDVILSIIEERREDYRKLEVKNKKHAMELGLIPYDVFIGE